MDDKKRDVVVAMILLSNALSRDGSWIESLVDDLIEYISKESVEAYKKSLTDY